MLRATGDSPRLTIELVPRTCWFSNVRKAVSRSTWDVLRRDVAARAGQRCEVCGGCGPRHPVECHEVWEYDDERYVQRLVRMTALCPACHEVKHIGLAGIRGRADEALQHLADVNDWTFDDADRYRVGALAEWSRRSRHEWTLDVECLSEYGLDPDKCGLSSARGSPSRCVTIRSSSGSLGRSR